VPPGGSSEFQLELQFPEPAVDVRIMLLYHRHHLPPAASLGLEEVPVRVLYEESFPLAELLALEG